MSSANHPNTVRLGIVQMRCSENPDDNMRKALAVEPVATMNHVESRYLIRLDDPARAEACAEKLQRVFGIRWVSPTVAVAQRAAALRVADRPRVASRWSPIDP